MKILSQNNWKDGYLDYHRGPNDFRIKVLAIKNLEKIEESYVVRPRSAKMVWNYLLKFGPTAVFRKIKSRISEEARNEKYISCGIGEVIETPETDMLLTGEKVVFILPSHPAIVERIVLPKFLFTNAQKELMKITPRKIKHLFLNKNNSNAWWSVLREWSLHSTSSLENEVSSKLLENAKLEIEGGNWSEAKEYLTSDNNFVSEFKQGTQSKSLRKKAILFGLGNYAKVQIIPNIKKYINLIGIHEIDPTQIPSNFKVSRIDTSPSPRENENYDALFIAGYHHTHTPIAIDALQKNKYAVAEKPIVVNREQLNNLVKAMDNKKSKFFAGFHKRYSPFNSLALVDLNVKNGDPIDYHCIAYEVPYPKYFWYNWPISKGPITANGCHWIDHFLYLNNWSKPAKLELFLAKNMTTNTTIYLENGAIFTMTLTEQGSSYIGVQDYVELRIKNKTAKIIDDSKYISEGGEGVIRKKSINKMKNYRLMYENISERIANDKEGDSLISVKTSTEAMLDLEDIYAKKLNELVK